jgi:hypothetical protein
LARVSPGDLKKNGDLPGAIYAPKIQPASLHSEITPDEADRLILGDYFNRN